MSEISSDQEAADSLKADLGDALQQAASLHLAGMSFLGSLGVAADDLCLKREARRDGE
jgi:hypothetical protein